MHALLWTNTVSVCAMRDSRKKKKKVKHMGCLIRQEMSQRANKDMPRGEMKDLAMQSTAPSSQFLPDWRGHKAQFPAGSAVRGGEKRVGLAGTVSKFVSLCAPFGAAALLLWSLPQTRQHCTVLHWPLVFDFCPLVREHSCGTGDDAVAALSCAGLHLMSTLSSRQQPPLCIFAVVAVVLL